MTIEIVAAEHLQADPEIVLLDAARTWAKVTSGIWFVGGSVFGVAVALAAVGVWQ